MTAVDPLSVSCDEFGCHVRATAPCMDRWGREVATHATRIGKARAVAEAREKSSVNPLLASCPRDNCEEAGYACIEWEVVEVGADGRPTASRAREVEPHPERVEKAERLAREIDAVSADRGKARARWSQVNEVRDYLDTLDADTVASIFEAIRHAPRGIAAIGRVLAKGGATLGVVGSAPDRTPLAHARKAAGHLRKALAAIDPDDRAPWAVDADTGELHATCAAGRLALAIEGVVP